MKYYFAVIIAVLVIVIALLFFILFKIYKLHLKAEDEANIYEQQQLLSNASDSKESTDFSSVSEPKDFLNNDLHHVALRDLILL